MMVPMRWATVRIVAPRKSSRSTCWSRASFSTSTLAVASSKSITAPHRSSARAMQSSWRSPMEKLLPPSSTFSSSPKVGRMLAMPALSQASWTSSSACRPVGSMFHRTVPEKRTGSWGMMVTSCLSFRRPRVEMSTEPIVMLPAQGSTIRRSAVSSVLFPLPLRPTMPTRSPAPTANETPLSAGSRCAWYRSTTSLNSSAAPGLEGGASASLDEHLAASWGASMISSLRSTVARLLCAIALMDVRNRRDSAFMIK
mmetsp:Transcript_17451/g.46375  ORF Transcript_17451/g.46375 Transcript_17451/m.46375 type:complete len:255 (-) Transcript_17451:894-1658(-)